MTPRDKKKVIRQLEKTRNKYYRESRGFSGWSAALSAAYLEMAAAVQVEIDELRKKK